MSDPTTPPVLCRRRLPYSLLPEPDLVLGNNDQAGLKPIAELLKQTEQQRFLDLNARVAQTKKDDATVGQRQPVDQFAEVLVVCDEDTAFLPCNLKCLSVS